MLSPTLSQTKWRITTEAENSARGSAFVLLWRLSAADLQANLHNRTSFAQVGRLNISAITFEYISSAFAKHKEEGGGVPTADRQEKGVKRVSFCVVGVDRWLPTFCKSHTMTPCGNSA